MPQDLWKTWDLKRKMINWSYPTIIKQIQVKIQKLSATLYGKLTLVIHVCEYEKQHLQNSLRNLARKQEDFRFSSLFKPTDTLPPRYDLGIQNEFGVNHLQTSIINVRSERYNTDTGTGMCVKCLDFKFFKSLGNTSIIYQGFL